MGLGLKDIAHCLDLKPADVQRDYGRELGAGGPLAVASVALSLFKAATEGNVTAQMFFLRCRGGGTWNDKINVAIEVKNNGDAVLSARDKLAMALGQEILTREEGSEG
jgi:hypothetical protein